MLTLKKPTYVGVKYQLEDLKKNDPCPGCTRVWAFLKNYRLYQVENTVEEYMEIKQKLQVWEMDNFDGLALATNKKDFSDFPGIIIPALKSGPKTPGKFILTRLFYIMIIGLCTKDPTKVLKTPLSTMMTQVAISVYFNPTAYTDMQVNVRFAWNEKGFAPPVDWVKLLYTYPDNPMDSNTYLTPVDKCPTC
jgi:hypothetical protein